MASALADGEKWREPEQPLQGTAGSLQSQQDCGRRPGGHQDARLRDAVCERGQSPGPTSERGHGRSRGPSPQPRSLEWRRTSAGSRKTAAVPGAPGVRSSPWSRGGPQPPAADTQGLRSPGPKGMGSPRLAGVDAESSLVEASDENAACQRLQGTYGKLWPLGAPRPEPAPWVTPHLGRWRPSQEVH